MTELDLFGAEPKTSRAIGGHHSNTGGNDEWLTPPWVIESLGPFDLDPCSPVNRPWPTAQAHMTLEDDGLGSPWPDDARVWCNPPYAHVWKWLAKLADHGNGVALIFARTETKGFREQVWEKADGLLFLHKRLSFHYVDGIEAKANSGAPSVLVAYGESNVSALEKACLPGALVYGWDFTGWGDAA